jgi:hypothetical protein
MSFTYSPQSNQCDRGHDGLHGGSLGVGGDRQGGAVGADGVDREQAFGDGSVGVGAA